MHTGKHWQDVKEAIGRRDEAAVQEALALARRRDALLRACADGELDEAEDVFAHVDSTRLKELMSDPAQYQAALETSRVALALDKLLDKP